MDNELDVYLDHLIQRENLRYKRSDEHLKEDISTLPVKLRLVDLVGDHLASRDKKLRKPDFQRATWAWTPEACVELLDTIVNEQVIPSIIMWPSVDSGYDFVLDGAHRISVVMAWLKDDWGQEVWNDPNLSLEDEELQRIQDAATTVRHLVEAKIGSFSDFEVAGKRFDEVVASGGAPKSALDGRTFKRAQFYSALARGSIGFDILWVRGDYERAEQSFLKINSTGKPLTDWERKLIENRNSSLARTIMSISNVTSARYYWPDAAPDGPDKEELREKIAEIVDGVSELNTALFHPPYETPLRRLRQPLLAVTETEKKPYWVAELVTIMIGGKGQEAETEKLLKRDANASEREIITTGHALINEAKSTLDHLIGPSSKSLGLVPSLYLYSENGRYVRSLLYGLIYWLVSSSSDDVLLARKRAFCAHRGPFEDVLRLHKHDIVDRLSRNSGSGPEVTYPTARYYQRLLELLIDQRDSINSDSFRQSYTKLLEGLTKKAKRTERMEPLEAKSRNFTNGQKNGLFLRERLSNLTRCGICSGYIDLEEDVQHDHIMERFRGGPTSSDNQRMVHPFCNNQANREAIEAMRSGKVETKLPAFLDPEDGTGVRQLSFFGTAGFI